MDTAERDAKRTASPCPAGTPLPLADRGWGRLLRRWLPGPAPRRPRGGGAPDDTLVCARGAPAPRHDPARSRLARLLRDVRLPTLDPVACFPVVGIGFGAADLGLDALALLPRWISGCIAYHGFGGSPEGLLGRLPEYPEQSSVLAALAYCGQCRRSWGRIRVYWGDPRRYILRVRGQAGLILLEPEQAEDSPALFSLEFLQRLGRLLGPQGALISPCGSEMLRRALRRLGLQVGVAGADGDGASGTAAAWDQAVIRSPWSDGAAARARISEADIPYRDFRLAWTSEQIIEHRDKTRRRLQARRAPHS